MLATASLAVGFLLLEGGLRLYDPTGNLHTTATLGIYTADPELGWRLRPDVRHRVSWLGRWIAIRTDRFGRRIPDGARTSATGPSLVFAGDSFVFGNEVEAQETFCWQAASYVGSPAVNLGVGGYSLDQSCRALARYASSPESPIAHAFLAVFIGNDIEFGAKHSRQPRVDTEGHLVDSEVPPIVRDFAARSRALLFLHKAYLVIQGRWRAWREVGASSRWIYEDQAWEPGALDAHRESLMRLAEATGAAGVRLTVLLIPESGQVYGSLSDLPNRRFADLLAEVGIPALDLLPVLRARSQADPGLYHVVAAGHLSPSGHAAVALAVASVVGTKPE